MDVQTRLNCVDMGEGEGAPVVFLHGFGGDVSSWLNFQVGLAGSWRSLAFDLPGHGGSLDYPKTCNAVVAAKAVLDDLEAMGIGKVHLAGHSMGGAAAAVIALRRPELVASLSLLAPGGFGPEINQALLRRYAAQTDEEGLQMVLEQFFGSEFRLPRAMAGYAAQLRQDPHVCESLKRTAEAILDGKRQKTLPLDELGGLSLPIKVIWGRQDRVIPVGQCVGLPAMIAVHIFEKAGHMVHLEASREVLALIRQSIRSAR
ncbi:alpha/beta fold hydrolase [Cohaesibacter marisflavi]|uniref:alpha/beta fold hydrolase n=1 Tax=Cohaesibacter marisflavi TaxID=655353 RepID=UPI000B7E4ECE